MEYLQEPIEFLRDWLKNRNEWLCSEWGIDPVTAYEESIPKEPETTTVQETTTVMETTAPEETETTISEDVTTVENGESTTADIKVTEPATKVKAPAKAQITKITAKKKASNKVKLSLKKIQGAAGYQIRIFKSYVDEKMHKE